MKDKTSMTIGTGCMALIIVTIILFFGQLLNFGLCYIAGLIAKVTIGKYLVYGFSLLNIAISLDDIPLLAATIGWIANFFASKSTSVKSSDR